MFKKIISFFERLSSKPSIGGLQITDSALEYAILKEGKAETFVLRLPPGVLRQGRLQNPEEFSKALLNLHEQIAPQKSNDVVKVIVVLPSEVVYTQSFSVPNINQEKLEESSRLNLEMISPISAAQAYMSSQVIGETQDRYELLGAFIERNLTDQYRALLNAARFDPIIFEFPALALSRVVREALGTVKESVLVLQISSNGLDIFIFRNDSLHFDYFRSWQSIQGEAREISKEVFEGVIIEETQKVINFSSSRFKETPKAALLIMPGLEKEIQDLLQGRFALQATPLVLQKYSLNPNWYTALGAALRGALSPDKDNFLALGTVSGVLSVFYEERILNFIRLWRNILTGVLGFFLVVFMISAGYLVSQTKGLQDQLANISVQSSAKDLGDLQNKAKDFNGLVAAITQARGTAPAWQDFFSQLNGLAKANQVILNQLNLSSLKEPITLTAQAPSHDAVLKFKNVLAAQSNFTNIDLPLSNIIAQPDNSIVFQITFSYAPTLQ
ncbi:MAG: hypothetical protein UY23_C0001G0336 [Candidatus Jorgensenbacteria bacterium GW2011_GWA1_48_11]|uniref:Type IV pilus assembly protein PilM n=1 Tax=Candidatus Jorgensenbacteria bacterium GW2011_GWA1_48_11 TaxID=1618660 RepID=A0A0G1XBQ5_9BACT|nr:MAG: hypothetical protein UY23_C0001G0336 [Candidatus Jorgensenbacteria bacterium GW2011_GWA1_48_11]KKW12221.1 MAG: hypothetical protein UY51_C0005G0463 [Candidatus Jorgensenbacteria bacterium GW2011_GWB1_49_9]